MATTMPSVPTRRTLPADVVSCLENARFLHLATCADNIPHVSLMNYTYLPDSPFSSRPVVVMTTPMLSRKAVHLHANPRVSLLVHDWVAHRPSLTQAGLPPPSPDFAANRPGSLADLLLGINTASLARTSTTINGLAELVPAGAEDEIWYRNRHVAHNTYITPAEDPFAMSPVDRGLWARNEPTGSRALTEDEQGMPLRVIVVHIKDGTTADWSGQVRDWNLPWSGSAPMVNGTG